jgi:hypothetical protein
VRVRVKNPAILLGDFHASACLWPVAVGGRPPAVAGPAGPGRPLPPPPIALRVFAGFGYEGMRKRKR